MRAWHQTEPTWDPEREPLRNYSSSSESLKADRTVAVSELDSAAKRSAIRRATPAYRREKPVFREPEP